jgi:O-antigen/teichoic acid export membrane protein
VTADDPTAELGWGPGERGRAPLRSLRSISYLVASNGLSAGLGILIWVAAARRLELAAIGAAAIAISIAALLANVSTLGLGMALTRHRHGDNDAFPGLLGGSLVLVTVTALTLSVGASVLIAAAHTAGASDLFLEPVWLTIAVIATAWCGLFDAVAIAEGDARAVMARSAATNLLRLVLLLIVVTDGRGMFVTAALAMSASLLVSAAMRRVTLRRVLHARPCLPRWLVAYALRHYLVTWIFNTPLYLVSVITGAVFGSAAAGSINLAWNSAFLLSTVGDATATVLLAEGARAPLGLDAAHRRLVSIVGVSMVAMVAVAVAGADLLGLVFGQRFDDVAVLSFRLFALAAIPYLFVTTAVARLRIERRPRLLVLLAVISGLGTCVGIVVLSRLAGVSSAGWAYLLASAAAAVPAFSLLLRSRPQAISSAASVTARYVALGDAGVHGGPP